MKKVMMMITLLAIPFAMQAQTKIHTLEGAMDKAYVASGDNGLGRITLKKNIVSGVNTLTQNMMQATNTIYVIQYDFTLGENITMPANCVLEFEGGSLSNGTLVGNDTQILAAKVAIFTGINISGTWNVPEITTAWFSDASSSGGLPNVIGLSDNDLQNVVIIEPGTYNWEPTSEGAGYLNLKSNTELVLLGTIQIANSTEYNYRIIRSVSKHNIIIRGGGQLIGDKDLHLGTSQTGHGIGLFGSENVIIEGISISKCCGDGILMKQRNGDTCNRIRINQCEIYDCGRQGISVESAKSSQITNCIIHDIEGAPLGPSAAIDVETLDAEDVVDGLLIENVIANNCVRGLLIIKEPASTIINVSVNNFKATSCSLLGLLVRYGMKNLKVSNCLFESMQDVLLCNSKNNVSDYPTVEICDCEFVALGPGDTVTPEHGLALAYIDRDNMQINRCRFTQRPSYTSKQYQFVLPGATLSTRSYSGIFVKDTYISCSRFVMGDVSSVISNCDITSLTIRATATTKMSEIYYNRIKTTGSAFSSQFSEQYAIKRNTFIGSLSSASHIITENVFNPNQNLTSIVQIEGDGVVFENNSVNVGDSYSLKYLIYLKPAYSKDVIIKNNILGLKNVKNCAIATNDNTSVTISDNIWLENSDSGKGETNGNPISESNAMKADYKESF